MKVNRKSEAQVIRIPVCFQGIRHGSAEDDIKVPDVRFGIVIIACKEAYTVVDICK